jgi:hypothetical protein
VAAVIGIGFPEVRPSGAVTDALIISETGRLKKEASTIPGIMAGQLERRVMRQRGFYL